MSILNRIQEALGAGEPGLMPDDRMAVFGAIQKRYSLDLLVAEWKTEVATMRRGDDPDWMAWSADCRAAWAKCMREIAQEDGFATDVQPEMGWLRGIEAGRVAA